jgi:fructokinase
VTGPIVVIGDVLIDELVDGGGSTSVPGGSALNVAVGLAVLGVPAVLVGMIGDDDDGRSIRTYLETWAVPFVATIGPFGTGRATSGRKAGEPSYRFNRASVERRINLDRAQMEQFGDARVIAISGFPFDRHDQVDQLLELVGLSPGILAIDPNPRAELITDLGAYRANLERLAASAALIKLSDEDAELLYGQPLADVIQRFLPLVSVAVLATEGRNGASLHARDSIDARQIMRDPRPIVDTMGAGDATFAVTLAALADTDGTTRPDWPTVLEVAMSTAAETIRHPGALLRRHPNENAGR